MTTTAGQLVLSWRPFFGLKSGRTAPVQDPEKFRLPPDERLRVLIVDDDRHVAAMIARFLKSIESDVETSVVHSGEAALEIAAEIAPHVVLVDLMMPSMSGFEVCEAIREDDKTSDSFIIAMTGFYDDYNVDRALSSGANRCLSKPFDNEALLELIDLSD